jgi:hypothetical protein
MPGESLSEKAVRAIAMVNQIEQAMQGVNDYGEATGFCDEQEQLVNDFHAALGSIRGRASRLATRLQRHQLKK